MGYLDFWKRLTPGQLNFAIQAFSLIAIFFEGYDQGKSACQYATTAGKLTLELFQVLWEVSMSVRPCHEVTRVRRC